MVSFYLNGDTRFESYAKQLHGKQLVLSFQTLAELLFWQDLRNWGEARRKRTSDLISRQFVVYRASRALCERWASVRANVQRSGRVMRSSNPRR